MQGHEFSKRIIYTDKLVWLSEREEKPKQVVTKDHIAGKDDTFLRVCQNSIYLTLPLFKHICIYSLYTKLLGIELKKKTCHNQRQNKCICTFVQTTLTFQQYAIALSRFFGKYFLDNILSKASQLSSNIIICKSVSKFIYLLVIYTP